MTINRSKYVAAAAALLALVLAAGQPALAETGTGAAPAANYRGAQWVQASFAEPAQESGLHLVDVAADGMTRPATDGGRQSVAGAAGGDQFFYFDVHDTYIHGGNNKVRLTIAYQDAGLTPLFLEYDSYDPLRPESKAEAVTRKRVPVAVRTNSEVWKTAYVDLSDARFLGTQPGGADFRIGSADELGLLNVYVMLISHEDAQPSIRVTLDGNAIVYDPNDVQPFVHPATNRTLVPFRASFNALGVANDNIIWHDNTRTVEAHKGQTTIMLTIDSKVAVVNGQPVALDQPATIVGDRTVVPLRFVAELFGLTVAWDGPTRTVMLTTPTPPVTPVGSPLPPTLPDTSPAPPQEKP